MKVIRWIAVPIAGIAGWYLALFSGIALFNLGSALCPKDLMVSGMCTAPWFGTYMGTVMFLAPSLAAVLMILGTAITAPSRRGPVSLATLAIGSGLAIALARERTLLGSAALSIVVGGVLAHWIWKREGVSGSDQREAGPVSTRAVIAVAALVTIASSSFFIRGMPIGPPLGRGPFTAKDLPRLTRALESHDNTLDAISAIGRIGPDAAPAVPLLVKGLDDPHTELVMTTVIALEHIGPAAIQASPRLRNMAVSTHPISMNSPRDAMKALAGIGDYEGVLQAGRIDDFSHQHGLADAVRAYEFNIPGLGERLKLLFQNGSSDYVKESAAMGLARVAPKTPGLVSYFAPKLEKLSTDYHSAKDEELRVYYSGQIKDIRKALIRIGTPEANELLGKFPAG